MSNYFLKGAHNDNSTIWYFDGQLFMNMDKKIISELKMLKVGQAIHNSGIQSCFHGSE